MNHQGEWSLSPAYDLIYSSGPGGEHSMTISGEGKAPTRAHVYKLGAKHGIKKKMIDTIVEQVSDAANGFQTHARTSGVSKSTDKSVFVQIQRNLDGFRRASLEF